MGQSVFFSYARKDGLEFCDRLSADLKAKGFIPWVDRSEIAAGETWPREIEGAIDECSAFLVVLTGAYRASTIAEAELGRATRRERRVIPLLVDAAADRSLFIENLNYIDFSVNDAYASKLDALVAALNQPADAPGPTAPAQRNVWTIAAGQLQRFIRQQQGRPERPGAYLPNVYVPREAAETKLQKFLEGDCTFLIVTGDAGSGKTSLLCHWANKLTAEPTKHIVLAYNCGLLAGRLQEEIAADAGVEVKPTIVPALDEIAAQAASRGGKLVLIFDAVQDYRGGGHSLDELLGQINNVASRLTATNVRAVLGCTASAWQRQERRFPARLDPSRVDLSGGSSLALDEFTATELEAAYALYKPVFGMETDFEDLPPTFREKLRDPGLLRLAAESKDDAAQQAGCSLRSLYWRLFDQRVQDPGERLLAGQIAAQMLEQQSAALKLSALAQNALLASSLLNEDPNGSFACLLDKQILEGTATRIDTLIHFSSPHLAAYAMALVLADEGKPLAEAVRTLMSQSANFALAWDVAQALLLLNKDAAALTELAESRDPETRELAADAIVELHHDSPAKAIALIKALLSRDSEFAHRVAVKAAYQIGPDTRPLLLEAATDRNASHRRLVRDTLYIIWRNETSAGRTRNADALYLIWRHAPDFTYGFLNELSGLIRLDHITEIPALLEFFLDLSITIYVNHCERPDVRDQTIALYKDLARNHLHLDLLNNGILGPAFEKLVSMAVSHVVSEQVLSWALFSGGSGGDDSSFWDIPVGERAALARIADLLDPAADVAGHQDEIAKLLGSGVPLFAGAAALVIGIHATAHFDTARPWIESLFQAASAEARQWMLAAFAVLLPDTPAEWLPLLESFTAQTAPDTRTPGALAVALDGALLPVGLAYGKAGLPMRLPLELIRKAQEQGDTPRASLLVQAMGTVGYYYPDPALAVLAEFANAPEPQLQDALVIALATIRTLHLVTVENAMQAWQMDEAFQRRVDVETSLDRVGAFFRVVGYYNHAVFMCVRYPKMRRQLGMDLLRRLAEAPSLKEAAGDYTETLVRMFREADFDLTRWTDAD